jgi:hypothetical protein
VFDANDSANNFLYTWSELTLAPADWWRFGLAVQRTKVYRTNFDIQRGFVVGFSYRRGEFSAYLLNPDASHPTWFSQPVSLSDRVFRTRLTDRPRPRPSRSAARQPCTIFDGPSNS